MDLLQFILFYLFFDLLPLAAATSCTVKSGGKSFGGTCQYTSQACAGSYTAGFCPGPSNFQCCHGWGSCSISGRAGTCQATPKSCGGTYVAGYCPGPSNIQCCANFGTCKVDNVAGKCQSTSSSCSGHYTPGYCPGPSNVQVRYIFLSRENLPARAYDGKCCTSNTGGGGGCPPAVNAATVALIKQWEGFVASPGKFCLSTRITAKLICCKRMTQRETQRLDMVTCARRR